ncbi:MAG: TetR/AcrR family transcriptional regulator [Acidimicrobiales bacterium]
MADDTKDRLLDAAWECVCTGGIAAATSRAITTRARANLGAITYHFGSKEQLLGEALAAAARRLLEPALEALRARDQDPATRMLRAVTALQRSLADSPEAVAAYLETIAHSHRIQPLGEYLVDLLRELRELLADDIARQQRAGLLPDWVDPGPMAALLLAVAQGVAVQTTIDPQGPPSSALAAQFAQLLLAGRSPASGTER